MIFRAFAALLFCLAAAPSPVVSQFEFLPEGHHFAPLKANIQEARIGVFTFLDAERMKVDVGNSIDLFGYRSAARDLRVTAGIDFMAYAFTTGAQGLRLQIDAIDGFFGGNLTASLGPDSLCWTGRLRLLHHSAHLVDGHYSVPDQRWIDNRQPVAFTRDFGEFVLARTDRPGAFRLRTYAGLSYATLVRPAAVERLSYLAGAEASTADLVGPLWSRPVNLFLAYQASLTSVGSYAATHQVQAGFKFGEWNGKGPALYVAYYHGRHMFAEYYNEPLSTIGAGFTVDFF
jgi:hypothetical protein